MSASLVGSEMCIRDRAKRRASLSSPSGTRFAGDRSAMNTECAHPWHAHACLLYTSDAADDSSV
eukprot:6901060-Alexandrium_andersonii.AAC.1